MYIRGSRTAGAIALLLVLSFVAYAQSDDIWSNLAVKETGYYRFSVPASLRQLPMRASGGPEQFFEASGMLLPGEHDGAPVVTTVFLVKMNVNNLEEAKESTIKGYSGNPDR